MENNRSNPLIHLLPSLRDVAFFMPALFILLKTAGASHLLEGDTGWHVRTGEWILQNGRVPDKDVFSFTRPGEPWFAWEWLWDVMFAWLHGIGGMAAVVTVSLLLISATTLVLYREIMRHNGNCLIAIALTFIASAAASIHWWARPHLFTLLFGLVTFSLLERAHAGNMRLLWLLPPLVILWTNLHGGFFIAILMAGAYAAGEVATAAIASSPEQRRVAMRRSGAFFGVAAASLAASLVNPYSYHLHAHIYQFLTTNWHFQNVLEFHPPNFQHPASRFFEAMLFTGLAAGLWHLRQRRFAYVFLLAGWAHLALVSARNIAIYALIAAPIIAYAIREWMSVLAQADMAGWLKRSLQSFADLSSEIGATDTIRRFPLARLVVITLLALLFFSPAPPQRFRAVFDDTYPEKALQTVANRLHSRVFTIDEWGDYLIYKLYPRVKVFVDGRSDFYGEAFEQKYVDTMNLKHGWVENLARYGVDTVLLPIDMPMTGALKESSHWRVIYDDGVAIVFELRSGNGNVVTQSSVVRHGVSQAGNSTINGSDDLVTTKFVRRN
ncbi:MAG TPA: hypothetical protein VM120_30025 [Bryobacteraceae bacterium]|nr:hypothetical protein [Bryobacteraceae bacterium]